MKNSLEIAVKELEHARIFISSREKMNETGIELYDEAVSILKDRLKQENEIQTMKDELESLQEYKNRPHEDSEKSVECENPFDAFKEAIDKIKDQC